MNDNRENYAPGVYGFKLKNLHHKAYNYAISAIGEPTKDNLVLYKDRENTLGLKYFDETELQQSVMNLQPLTKRLMLRDNKEVMIDSNEYWSVKKAIQNIRKIEPSQIRHINGQKTAYRHPLGGDVGNHHEGNESCTAKCEVS